MGGGGGGGGGRVQRSEDSDQMLHSAAPDLHLHFFALH